MPRGIRPETAADRAGKRRALDQRDIANRAADPARAFEAASAMEDHVIQLRRAVATVRIIAYDEGLEEEHREALLLVADALKESTEKIETSRAEIFHRTWAYAHGGIPKSSTGRG